MTRVEANEWLRLKRDEIHNRKEEIDRLAEAGKHEESMALLNEFIGLVDPSEAYAVALIADGEEPLS